MSKHHVFSPDAETIGQVHLSLLNSITVDEYRNILEQHGFDHIDPKVWYPTQAVLDILDAIEAEGGGTSSLVSVGMKIMENAILPPEIDAMPFDQILSMWDQFYLANNRGSDPGYIQPERVSAKHFIMTSHIPYPDDYGYGGFYGGCKRWLQPGVQFTVYYDEKLPRRDQHGAETTVIHITWN